MHNHTPHLTAALRTGRMAQRAAAFGLAAGLALPAGAAWQDGENGPAWSARTVASVQQVQDAATDAEAQAAAEAAVAAAAARAAEEAAAKAAEEAARTWHVPVGVYYISSPFGEMRYSGPHIGLDFAGNDGVPVVASRHGVVTQAGWEGGYGYAVTVDHGDGHSTKYAHLAAQPLVAVGQPVVGGQHMGFVGNTGDSTGPHLHFELRRHGQPIDPGLVIAIPPTQGLAAS